MTSAVAEALSEAATALRCSTVRIFDSGRSAGSGIIWRDDGLIITNAHVARGSSATVEDVNGRRFPARIEARNPRRDLAALRIHATGLPTLTKAVNALRVGDLVIALGNPLGIPGAVVTGIVHATGSVDGVENLPWIQADIRLAPGNSGGPLADARCRIAGVNSMIAGGVGLAVPADSVEKFLNGGTDQPTIGISVQAVRIPAPSKPVLALLVEDVATGSAAARSGIRPGDLLIGYSEKKFRQPTDLLVALRSGERTIALDVLRANRQVRIEVPLTA